MVLLCTRFFVCVFNYWTEWTDTKQQYIHVLLHNESSFWIEILTNKYGIDSVFLKLYRAQI